MVFRSVFISLLLFAFSASAQERVSLAANKQACLPNCFSTQYRVGSAQEVNLFRFLPGAATTAIELRVYRADGSLIKTYSQSNLSAGGWTEINFSPVSGSIIVLYEEGAKGLSLFYKGSSNAEEASDELEPSLETVRMWELKQWDIYNFSHEGNPFDVEAVAVFTHSASGRKISTDLFYDGGVTWSFRFTAPLEGEWTFNTQSTDKDLDQFSGEFVVESSRITSTGFLTTRGSKFAIQTRNQNAVRPFLFNVFQDRRQAFPNTGNVGELSLAEFSDNIENYVQEAKANGMDVVFGGIIANAFYQYGTIRADENKSEEPDLDTFRELERAIINAHKAGGHIHFWAWGDRERNWVSPYPINGELDKRLQRYIAARLGALPGWSMGYGFDLQEWVSENQVNEWGEYLLSRMSYPRVLTARGMYASSLPVQSYSRSQNSYLKAVANIESDQSRPHFFEERDVYLRSFGMEETRRLMWQYALAGGHGGFWGYSWDRPVRPYPEPQQLITFKRFWSKHFYFDQYNSSVDVGLEGRVVVLYEENTASLAVSSNVSYAVDTKRPYREVPVEVIGGEVILPYISDWAVVFIPGQ